MLTLTENASTIVKEISQQIPEANGLRITSADQGEPTFEVEPAASPEDGDQIVEQDGATVYLNEPAALQLDDKILDAGVDEQGGVQFAIGIQGDVPQG